MTIAPSNIMLNSTRDWLGAITLSCGVVGLSLLGGVARLLQDSPDSDTPITKRDWLRYCSSSLVAGILLSTLVHYYHGTSPLLLGVAGLGGFGAMQILGLGMELVKMVLKRLAEGVKK